MTALTLDFDTLIDSVQGSVQSVTDWAFIMSPRMERRIRHLERLAHLYRACPYPPRKLRKCHARKLQRARRKGMQRIRRMEQREAQWEQEVMRHD